MRKEFAKILIDLAKKDDKLVVLIGDISHYLLKDFEKQFPNRFYNVGICEQSMVGLAAGLASEGFRPIVHTIAPFCVERAYEQIKIDLCYQKLDVTIVSVGGSFDYAHLGCTHHCYSDISILRPLPNMEIYCPGNENEFSQLFKKSWNNGAPKYFKLFKDTHNLDLLVEPYEACFLNTEEKGPIIFTTSHLLEICKNIVGSPIVYLPTIEPLSKETENKIVNLLKRQEKCITFEENSEIGGCADKIFDIASAYGISIQMKKIGIPRKFCENYGNANDHRKALGISYKNIMETLNEL